MSKVQRAPPDADPAWKRNNRDGPLDWWLGCRKHGANLSAEGWCATCTCAAAHNRLFAAKLALEPTWRDIALALAGEEPCRSRS
jgi:hypothetical protein